MKPDNDPYGEDPRFNGNPNVWIVAIVLVFIAIILFKSYSFFILQSI